MHACHAQEKHHTQPTIWHNVDGEDLDGSCERETAEDLQVKPASLEWVISSRCNLLPPYLVRLTDLVQPLPQLTELLFVLGSPRLLLLDHRDWSLACKNRVAKTHLQLTENVLELRLLLREP